MTFYNKHGKAEWGEALIDNVACNEKANFSLLIIDRCLKEWMEATGDINGIVLTNGEMKIKFDTVVKTNRCVVYCAMIKRSLGDEVSTIELSKRKLTADGVHRLLMHKNMIQALEVVKHLGWQIDSKRTTCQDCAEAKKSKIMSQK